MLACNLDGRIRSAADKDRNAFRAIGFDVRKPVLDLIIFPAVIEWLLAGPFSPDNIGLLAGKLPNLQMETLNFIQRRRENRRTTGDNSLLEMLETILPPERLTAIEIKRRTE